MKIGGQSVGLIRNNLVCFNTYLTLFETLTHALKSCWYNSIFIVFLYQSSDESDFSGSGSENEETVVDEIIIDIECDLYFL